MSSTIDVDLSMHNALTALLDTCRTGVAEAFTAARTPGEIESAIRLAHRFLAVAGAVATGELDARSARVAVPLVDHHANALEALLANEMAVSGDDSWGFTDNPDVPALADELLGLRSFLSAVHEVI